MAFVQFSQVSLAFGDRDILKNVSVNLQTGTKAALTGANGAGKSTLIKVMAGLIQPDSGTRAVQKDCRISYLPQSGLTHHGCSLKEEADKAFEFGYEIQKQIDKIGEDLQNNPSNMQTLLERQANLIQALEESGWHRRDATAESVLLGLGFSHEDLTRQTEEFSGGWQMRIALAKALMQNPDIHGKGAYKYDNVRIGVNSRLDSVQAAILEVKLEAFAGYELEAVNKAAAWYDAALAGVVKTPVIPEGYLSSWAQYTIQLPSREVRDGLQEALKAQGIPTMVYYPKPMHSQTAFADVKAYVACPNTDKLCDTVLSLPMHPYLDEETVKIVCDAVKAYFA
ncbi:MAG: DegT/DnrJ/EryC1/StrS family aminotransferase [Treponema sp.]|nr:DegT/DnrJ/EryC1/StrS family aminotransferase [Treponema sp.]